MPGDKDRYAEFCRNTYVPLHVQPWWLDAVCGPGGWAVALTPAENGPVTGALPYFRTRRAGLSAIRVPPLSAYAGPWWQYPDSARSESARLAFAYKTCTRLIGQLPRVAFFQQAFRPEIRHWMPFLQAGFHQTTRYTYVLPAGQDPDAVYARLKNTLRTDLKRAAACTTVALEDAPDLVFRLNAQSFARKGLRQPYAISTFRRLYDALRERGQCAVFIARGRQDGAPRAGLLLAFDERQAAVLMAGFDPVHRASSALHGLYWEAVKFSLVRGLSLDFEGSMQPGIERVFRGFGGVLTPYALVWKAENPVLKWWLRWRTY